MKTKIGKEIALLCLPILAIAGGAFYLTRLQSTDIPPENLNVGFARLVVGKWQETDPTPFDIYRGYSRRFEVKSWIGGAPTNFPAPSKGTEPGGFREVTKFQSSPQVFYQTGEDWHRLFPRPVKSLVKVEMKPTSEKLRVPLTHVILVRSAALPVKSNIVHLRGIMGEQVTVAQKVPISVRPHGYLFHKLDLRSGPVDFPFDLSRSIPIVSQQTPLKLKQVSTYMSGPKTRGNPTPRVYFAVAPVVEWKRSWTDRRKTFPTATYGSRLLDATGKQVAKSDSNSDFFVNTYGQNQFGIIFTATPQEWKQWQRPLTLQTALSIDNCWPLEVNVQFPSNDIASQDTTPSPLPFYKL